MPARDFGGDGGGRGGGREPVPVADMIGDGWQMDGRWMAKDPPSESPGAARQYLPRVQPVTQGVFEGAVRP